jgi:uncharacterized delta-60 repeat protein
VTVQVTPAGPLALTGGSSATLTATASLPGFNVAGSGFDGTVFAVTVQADGKVLVGGRFTAYNGNATAPDNLVRLNADGSLDNTFNNAGAGANDVVRALTVQPDGKVLVGGDFRTYNGNSATPDYVLRLNADGSLDNTFNPGGTGPDYIVLALVGQPDGKVLVGGDFRTYNGNSATPDYVLRLNADGSLDNTFNPGGTGANNYVRALAVQADGKVLVGGDFTAYNGNPAAPNDLLRLNADGTLDNTFNNGTTAGPDNIVQTLAVQADGKVLAGGTFTAYNGSATAPDRVMRLNADGSLDNTFNLGGTGANSSVLALVVQADGKVLIGGDFTAYNSNASAPDNVLRLNADGTLDNTFNLGGAGPNSFLFALAVQADGKVLIGGNFTTYNGNGAAPDRLLRINADGSLNDAATPLAGATFVFTPGNTAGSTRTVTTAGTYTATATDPATGCTYTSNAVVVTTPAPTLATLSPSSGLAGSTLAATGTNLQGASAITFTSSTGPATAAPAGYVVASDGTGISGIGVPAGLAPGAYTLTVTTPNGTSNGRTYTVVVPAPAISSFAPTSGAAGTPVTLTGTNLDRVTGVRFGTGTLTAEFGSQSATSLTVRVPVVSSTGVITLTSGTGASVSSATNFTYTPRPGGLVATLSPAGPLDVCQPRTLTATASSPAFATGTGFSGTVDPVNTLVVQADGKVLVGGRFTRYNGTTQNRLVRLNPDGSPDAGFATGTGFNSTVSTLAVQADGKVLVGGNLTTYQGTAANYIARLNADGSRDTGFNTGTSFAGTNTSFSTSLRSVAVQADGKVLVGGAFSSYNGTTGLNGLVRLNPDGSRDAGFATGTGFNSTVSTLAVQADGKVLVGGGFTTYNGTAANYIARLNADGSLDAGFVTGTGFAGTGSLVSTIAVQADGKVLVGGGFTTYNGTAANYIARLNADGSLDAGFVTSTGFSGFVSTIAVQADGKVLVGGSFTTYNGTAANYIARLNADGSLDAGFVTGTGFNSGVVRSVAAQADGKVLVGGSFTTYNGTAANYIARLNADGSLNNAATAVPGASFTFSPGNTSTNPLVTSTAGSYTATASLNGETSAASNTVVLTDCLVPVLASINPSSGLVGSSVTLTGSTLTGATAVTFTSSTGTATAASTGYVVASDGTGITGIVVPTGLAAGPYTVTVTTPNGISNGLVFTVTLPVPSISSFAPISGAAGTPVTLTGTDLSGATAVTVNGVAVMPANVTSTTLSFVVPAGAGATQAITVTTPGGTSAPSAAFAVLLLAGQAGTSPTPNTVGAPVASSALAVGFSEPVSAASAATLAVFSAQAGGLKAGTVTTSGSTASYVSTLPTVLRDFRAGETVNVTVPASVLGAGGLAATPYVYQFTTATVASPGIFAPPVSYPTGQSPENVAVADFNSDGILDLVTANNGTGVSVLLGDGTGSFGTPTNYALSGYPAGVAAGDVNGDGRLDIVVANLSSSSVQVLLGQAGGSFAAAVDYPNSNAVALALGDFNGDGRLDIVTADFGPSVSVLLGQAGGFGATTKYAVSGRIRGVAVGDVNSDGRLDLVAANNNASNVTVLLGDGTGGFGTPTNYPAGANPYSVAVGDVNKDGRPDLVTANSGVASVSVLLGQATGGFAAPVDYATSVTTAGLALGDVNGDGRLDIAVAEFGNGSVSDGNGVAVLLGQAGGTFAARVDYAAGLLARGLVLGDVNNDGRLDILTANQSANTTAVLLNLAAPLPVELTAFTATAGTSGTVRLAWTTASEKNSQLFEVERSADGVTFGKIGTLAAAGTSLTPRAYALLDAKLPTGATVLYYRLRQVDLDGTAHYSVVRTVALAGASAGLSLYPNPAHGGAATLLGAQPGTVVTVLDALGRTVATAPADASGTAVLVLPQGLAAGVYVVRAGQQALRLTVE